jgi:hypothetical protein
MSLPFWWGGCLLKPGSYYKWPLVWMVPSLFLWIKTGTNRRFHVVAKGQMIQSHLISCRMNDECNKFIYRYIYIIHILYIMQKNDMIWYLNVFNYMYLLSTLWSPLHSILDPDPTSPAHRSVVPIRRLGRHGRGAANRAPATQRVPRELREAFQFVGPGCGVASAILLRCVSSGHQGTNRWPW